MICTQKFSERPDVKVAEIVAKQVLDSLCLGKPMEEQACNCGAIHLDAGVVTAVVSPGDKYGVYQVAEWYLWSLEITTSCGKKWFCGVDDIVPTDKLENLFSNCFDSLNLF